LLLDVSFGFTTGASRGFESERWREIAKVQGGDFPQCRQQGINLEPLGKCAEGGLATDKKLRQETQQNRQAGMNGFDTATGPADGTGQFNIPAQLIGRCFKTSALLHLNDDRFDLAQGA
jgi:hypothetical protein